MNVALFSEVATRAVFVLALTTALFAQTPDGVTIASNTSWQVFEASTAGPGVLVGNAQFYCLNSLAPKVCPAGATNYGAPPSRGWSADLSIIQQSPDPAERGQWIWAPGITGSSTNADFKAHYFQRKYTLTRQPTQALLYLAVDDFAIVYVNGTRMGQSGSVTSLTDSLAAQSALKQINIWPALVVGENTITVFVQNGPGSFNGCTNCTYSQNAAGVVFGGFIDYKSPPTIPPVLLGQPGVPPNQSGGVGLYGIVPGRYDLQPGINALQPPQSVVSTAVPVSYVNTSTGNHVLEYRDHVYPGQELRFSLVRYYNSMDPYSGPLGPGWMHSYNVFLRRDSTTGRITYKQADGREVVYGPASGGQYAAETKGVFEILSVDANGFIITKPNRNVLRFSPAGKLTSITAESGEKLEFFYNAAGDLYQIRDSESRVFTLTYLNHLLTTVAVGSTTLAKYEYTSGRLSAFVDVAGKRSEYSYGVSGQLTVGRQPNGVASFTNTFNIQGRVAQQVNATGKVTTFSYVDPPTGNPSAGRSTLITDPLGRTMTHEFDSKLRLITVIDALGGVTRYTYDANNNVASVTDPNGNTMNSVFNDKGLPISVTDPVGNVRRYTYDLAGRLLASTNGRGNTTVYTYDTVGNLVREVNGAGNATTSVYDSSRNLISRTDANGSVTRYSYYPASKNIRTVTDAKGGVTTYTYDAAGNRTGLLNAAGNFTLFCYDTLHKLTSIVDPPGAGGSPTCGSAQPFRAYEYDTLGNITAYKNGNGQITRTTYDGSNRPLTIVAPDSTTQYTYDGVGNRLTMTDSNGSTTYVYDALNRMTSSLRSPGVGMVIYAYDRAGNRIRVTYPDGKSVMYEYDRANRPTKVVDWASKTTFYDYDAANNVVRTAAGTAVTATFTYDAAERLLQVSNAFSSGSEPASLPMTRYTYQLDAFGNRVRVTDGAGQGTAYTYDPLHQLLSAVEPSKTTTYSYDPVGNRTHVVGPNGILQATYNSENVLLMSGSTVYQHDADGNRISETSTAGSVKYFYDARGRLIKVMGPMGTTLFAYDGDGNRIRQDLPWGSVIQYLNDDAAPLVVVLQEKLAIPSSSPSTAPPPSYTSYVWGRSLISAYAPTFQHFYVYDGLSSVVGLTDQDGKRKQRYAYDPWGQLTTMLPTTGTGSANPYKFTGEVQDPGTGLYYLRSRYYDPATGRFISSDNYFSFPLLPLSLNKFVYVRNNPVRYIDRTGRDPWPESIEDPWGSDYSWPFSPPWP